MNNKNSRSIFSPFLLILSIFLICILTYLVTPSIYKEMKNSEYNTSLEIFCEELVTSSSPEELALTYALENDAIVAIRNQTNTINYQTPSIQSKSSLTKTTEVEGNQPEQNFTISVTYTFQDLSDITSFSILLLGGLSIIFAGINLLYVAMRSFKKDDYIGFIKVTDDMLRMKPKAKLSEKGKKKVQNILAKNINDLYDMLWEKHENLDQRNRDYQLLVEQTNQSTHLLKNNLEAKVNNILKMVVGMINNEGPYARHSIYLLETKVQLEELLEEPKTQSEIPSTIHEVFETVLMPYEMLAGQKQVNIKYHFEKNFKVVFDGLMFHQAMGHLMTYVLNQCDIQSTITFTQDEYDFILSYKGACLTQKSIEEVEKVDENIKALYRYARQLGFFIEYSQTEQKDGMQFVFHF